MKTIQRTPIKDDVAGAPMQQAARANLSATQWLFNPYSVCDTTNYAVTTGVGKLAVGGLTKVVNIVENFTPNESTEGNYTSTVDFAGVPGGQVHGERERFAQYIANDITTNFPRRVHRIKALEGMDDTRAVQRIESLLLGDSMAIAEVEGDSVPVPVLTQMREVFAA